MDYSHVSLIHFQAGSLSLALPMSQVSQIMGELPVRVNQKAVQPYGFTAGPEGDIPVIDLAARLGKQAHVPGDACQFISLKDGDRNLVLLVEKVIHVRRSGTTAFKPLPNPVHHLSRSLLLAGANEEPTIFLLDFEGLAHLAGLETQPSQNHTRPGIEPQRATAKTSQSMLSFTSTPQENGLRWGLSTTQVAEVLKVDTFETLPVVPSYFLGLLWWREEPVPVIDLNLRMGEKHQGASERVLIAKMLGHPSHIGLTCGSNMRLERDLAAYRDLELNPTKHPSFALAAFEKENDVVVFPNIDAILA